VSTPSSSHLLSRVASSRYLPLVFSIKQTAVPAGLLLAGLIGPPLTQATDWRVTMLVSAAAGAIFVLMLQPVRRDLRRRSGADAHVPIVRLQGNAVIGPRHAESACARLCVPCVQRLQTVMTAYFVVYLTTIGYTPSLQGSSFRLRSRWRCRSHSVGLARQQLRHATHHHVRLAFGMAVSVALLALSDASWPTLLVGLVACRLSATALSWHGILLAETARAAPEGMRGGVTGGVLSFGAVGALGLSADLFRSPRFDRQLRHGFLSCAAFPRCSSAFNCCGKPLKRPRD
jgi:MFS family permease